MRSRRLVLRPLDNDHRDALHALWTAPGVRRYLWDDEILPLSRTAEILEQNETLRVITLTDLEPDAAIPDALFEFEVPADANVFEG